MNTETKENKEPSEPAKTGFFTRILNKVDNAMKTKADAAAKNSCCGGDDKNDKGGKCC